jgi:hypothetical protein
VAVWPQVFFVILKPGKNGGGLAKKRGFMYNEQRNERKLE